jgi:hypothetical protein
MDCQERSCEDLLRIDETSVPQFERLQLPKDILTIEQNEIHHIITDEDLIIGAENQREHSGMTYPDITYSGIKAGIQIKDVNAKEKAKTQSVGKRAHSNHVRVGRAVRRKKWTWRVVLIK